MGKSSNQKKLIEKKLVDILGEAFGENLVSVMLYGSYVSGNFVKGVSDINVLILLKEVKFEQLKTLGIKSRKLFRKYNITPLFLTEKGFFNSCDVFPMEYFDIKDRHRVIYGEDKTTSITLTRKNLRHQIEDRLRGNIVSLRQLIVQSGGNKRIISRELKVWAGPLNALFRGILRLSGDTTVPIDSEEILKKLSKVTSVDTTAFIDLFRFKKGQKFDLVALTERVVLSLENLIEHVDKVSIKED